MITSTDDQFIITWRLDLKYNCIKASHCPVWYFKVTQNKQRSGVNEECLIIQTDFTLGCFSELSYETPQSDSAVCFLSAGRGQQRILGLAQPRVQQVLQLITRRTHIFSRNHTQIHRSGTSLNTPPSFYSHCPFYQLCWPYRWTLWFYSYRL